LIIMSNFSPITWIILGLIFLVLGILSLFKKIIIWWVNVRNDMNGIKTEITPITILWWRIGGAILILVGLLFCVFYLLYALHTI